jgi:hypothetical protein
MSLDIWMQREGPSRLSALSITAWRVVEAQHKVSTRRLVDTLDEQQLLEQIVDEVKPPIPAGPGFAGLHYLLSTPFRHPPLRHGSRFGSSAERSLWYGAAAVETSLAEKAYYQLLFVEGTKAELKNLSCDWSAFTAHIATDRAIDLTRPEFAAFHARISSPSSYGDSQKLGRDMRAGGVTAFTFTSARCPRCPLEGKVVGLFEPVFASANPGELQTWRCIVTADACEVVTLNGARSPLVFMRSAFEIDGALPAPSLF